MIRELRSGGIGTAAPIPTPEPETLLHNFQEKAAEMRLEIEKLEVQVEQASQYALSPATLEAMKRKIIALTERETVWIQKIGEVLQLIREVKGRDRNGVQRPANRAHATLGKAAKRWSKGAESREILTPGGAPTQGNFRYAGRERDLCGNASGHHQND
jgi:hypothetical protein